MIEPPWYHIRVSVRRRGSERPTGIAAPMPLGELKASQAYFSQAGACEPDGERQDCAELASSLQRAPSSRELA